MCRIEQLAPERSCTITGPRFPMLHEFITAHRDEIIVRCETKVKARADSPPITLPRYSGVPVFLDQLVDELRQGTTDGGMCNSGSRHGHDLLSRGFTLSEVVHDTATSA